MNGGSGRALADRQREQAATSGPPHPAQAITAGPPRRRWADLRLRVLSAAVLAPLALGCVWLGGLPWYGLVVVAGLGICWEWAHMAHGRAAALAAGFAYAGLAVLALACLRAIPGAGRGVVLFLLAVVWSSDVGAYVTGRLFGGPRLAPSISPGKTWSGAAGGLASAVLVGAAAAGLGWGHVGLVMLAAGVLGIAAQIGDLLESAVKRHFGVKDSGRLIPGHGGLLDRLDGLMAASLVAGAWLWTAAWHE